jgi:hypothetical protein
MDFLSKKLIPEILKTYQLEGSSIPDAKNSYFLYKKIGINKKDQKEYIYFQNQIETMDKNGQLKKRIPESEINKPWETISPIKFFISTELIIINNSEEDVINGGDPYFINHEKFEALEIPKKEQNLNQLPASKQVG